MKRLILLVGLAAAGTGAMAAWLTPRAQDLQPARDVRLVPDLQPTQGVRPARDLQLTQNLRPARHRQPAPTVATRTEPTVPSSTAPPASHEPSSPYVDRAVLPPARDTAFLQGEPEPLVVPAGAVLGVRLLHGISSETAVVDDRVEGIIVRDVTVDGRTAVPAGTRVLGTVTDVVRAGKLRGAARVSVRFHTLALANGERVSLQLTPVVREEDGQGRASAAKIGGSTVGGAVIGGIMGGRKGAVLGGVAGAGAGTVVAASGSRPAAELIEGLQVTVRLEEPFRITIDG